MEKDMNIEVRVFSESMYGVAASSADNNWLKPDMIDAIHEKMNEMVSKFQPKPVPSDGMELESVELKMGFKISLENDGLLKLIMTANGEASIDVKAKWSRKSATNKCSVRKGES